MYYPVQIPYILNKEFSEFVCYSEHLLPRIKDFVICFWEMQSLSSETKTVENIIITDGCIDLVVDFDGKEIGFAGMSKTEFHFKMKLPSRSFGVRFKPGAFFAITNIPADRAMDSFIPIAAVDKNFDTVGFFDLPFESAKEFFKSYVEKLTDDKPTDNFLFLFDRLVENIPVSVASLYDTLNFSPRQTQRLFLKNFGLTPQLVLCILRFQKCLEVLTSGKASPCDILNLANYYDQAHMIKDFKRNIGITPFELIRKYR